MDTIFALSSGKPPAAIAVVRLSGPHSRPALDSLAGRVPQPRRVSLVKLRDGEGNILDHALALWLPGPDTVSGEDMAELHLHGGRAVIAAVESALAQLPGMRAAEPGEFTRRAFANGRMDLAEAEGLAELLSAESELQRRLAVELAGGALSAQVGAWLEHVLLLSAELEAQLDFGDEDDVAALDSAFFARIEALAVELANWLARPRTERLREGFRLVIAGPPNAGKSTLFNALLESEAAITSAQAGTTRDVLERPVAFDGVPFSLVDTAGLRGDTEDEIERIGIGRAQAELARADLVLWLGPEGEGPEGAWEIETKLDESGHAAKHAPRHRVSALTGAGVAALKQALVAHARDALPKPGEGALNARQARFVGDAQHALAMVGPGVDALLVAENLRVARAAFDRLTGRASTEDMLDTLFGRFCIGK
ncbi:MAG: tRNA uridine-5-carboxymethylaminomethyl(34) synthesis GTPase MnmE [Sphingomonadaceae bacterium]|nr:tRNA uridine-5-carboxymethylaminomethyl(34) synthesis GTPase MnmE [Sphingomonadaceae bacterium]